MNIGPKYYESLKGLDLAVITQLEKGPDGFHNEEGFEIVEDAISEDASMALPPVVVIPVFAVLCKSEEHYVPQYRYVSPYELARGRVEIADRIVAVRIDVADQDLSELVVGRNDDVLEELRDNGKGLLLERLARFVVGAAPAPFRRVVSLALRLPTLIRGALS